MNKETIWITELEQIPAANDESLKRSLITLDGRGEVLKKAALEELLTRVYKRGVNEGKDK